MLFLQLLKSFRCISVTVLILCLVGCNRLFGSTTTSTTYSVKKVSDGDTLAVTDTKGTDIKVRFACIDAPEVPHSTQEKNSKKAVDKNQFKWGVQAQQRVQQLIKQGGNNVNLTITDTDRYGRKISEVRLANGTFIQQVLTKEGLAQVYTPYLKNCPSASIVQKAETDAKQQRAGVWGDKKYIPAWEWRSKNK